MGAKRHLQRLHPQRPLALPGEPRRAGHHRPAAHQRASSSPCSASGRSARCGRPPSSASCSPPQPRAPPASRWPPPSTGSGNSPPSRSPSCCSPRSPSAATRGVSTAVAPSPANGGGRTAIQRVGVAVAAIAALVSHLVPAPRRHRPARESGGCRERRPRAPRSTRPEDAADAQPYAASPHLQEARDSRAAGTAPRCRGRRRCRDRQGEHELAHLAHPCSYRSGARSNYGCRPCLSRSP